MADASTQTMPEARPGLIGKLVTLYWTVAAALTRYAEPVLNLFIRVWMANIFFKAGLIRVERWGNQEFMFTDIHPVPGIPASIAAPLVTAAEILLPVMSVLGIFARLPAAGMLVMTMVIQFVVAQTPQGIENKIGNAEHYIWMILLGYVVLRGPREISADFLLGRWWKARA
jgi:putative oxidoreductase